MIRFTALLAALALCFAAHAQGDYPSKPVRLVTPFNPGGAIDVLTRLIGERLEARLGQPVVVEAIPGANTIIGTQAMLKGGPDGHTLMITTMSTTVNNPVMYSKLPYDPVKDLAPITQLSNGSVLLVAPASAPCGDVRGFIEWAKGFELPLWVGVYAPGGTPKAIRERLQRELRAIINDPEITKRMHDQGQVPIGNTPDEFQANYLADAPKWAELIRASGAKVE